MTTTDPTARIWLADIGGIDDARLAPYERWLGPGERQRAFPRRQRRRQFVAARALLRLALAEMLDIPPAAIVLDEVVDGPPALSYPALPMPGISISHSGTWVACALSRGTALAIDIETLDAARDIDSLIPHAFDAATRERLAALPEAQRRAGFYRQWTAREARIKLGGAAATSIAFDHPRLAIALCTALTMTAPPTIHLARL
jgi:4'-phosphopantetheinyl transferase